MRVPINPVLEIKLLKLKKSCLTQIAYVLHMYMCMRIILSSHLQNVLVIHWVFKWIPS